MKNNLKHSKTIKTNYIPKSELNQFKKPYNSTIAFYNLLSKLKLFNKNTKRIIDVGTGIGSNLQYFSNQQKNISFLGTDYQSHLIKLAKKLNKNNRIKFRRLNILKNISPLRDQFDGLLFMHFVVLKELDKVIKNMYGIKPRWIAINSLFLMEIWI